MGGKGSLVRLIFPFRKRISTKVNMKIMVKSNFCNMWASDFGDNDSE